MDYKVLLIKKVKWWQEIKSLGLEYDRNTKQIDEIEKRQSDISFEVKKLLNKIQEETEKYDEYCYKNKVGEFME